MFVDDLCGCKKPVKPSVFCRKAYVASNSKMDFLADKVAAMPEFAEEDAAPSKKQR